MSPQEFIARLRGATEVSPGHWMALCPAHADHNPSLSVDEGDDGRILVKCRAGCATEAVVRALGLEMRDLFEERRPPRTVRQSDGGVDWASIIRYVYTTPDGAPLICVVRVTHTADGRPTKQFFRQIPDSSKRSGWRADRAATRSIEAMYRWPELRKEAERGDASSAWVVEGEKDADNLAAALRPEDGAVTCPLGGSSHWCEAYAAELRNIAHVVVIADNDAPGIRHARRIVRDCSAARVHAATLPAEINGHAVKDVSDALAAGWTRADLLAWAAESPALPAADDEPQRGAGGGPAQPSADGGTLRPLAARIADALDRESVDHRRLDAEGRRAVIDRETLAYLREEGAFYRDAECPDIAHALYYHRATHRLMAIASDRLTCWLALESGVQRSSNTWRELISAVETEAVAGDGSADITPALYWARRPLSGPPAAIYISSGEASAVRITADSIDLVDNGTDGVLFAAGKTLSPWRLLDARAARGPTSVSLVGTMAAAGDERQAQLLVALWMLALPLDLRSKPPLVLCGGVGSGKTRLATGIQELLGLPVRAAAVRKNGEDDFWVSLHAGGISILDNADTRTDWLPDAAAAAATNGTREARRLYTDDELAILRARAALIITSANPTFATDAGLADRLLVVRLARRRRDTADSALSDEIAAARDAVMTWLARTISAALRVDPAAAPQRLNRRHPDFAAWAWRCSVALGVEADGVAALTAAEAEKSIINVAEDRAFGARLLDYFRAGGGDIEDKTLLVIMSSRDQAGRAVYLDYGDYSDHDSRRPTTRSVGVHLKANWTHYEAVFAARRRTLQGYTVYTFRKPADSILRYGADDADAAPDTAQEAADTAPDAPASPSAEVAPNPPSATKPLHFFKPLKVENGPEVAPSAPPPPADDPGGYWDPADMEDL